MAVVRAKGTTSAGWIIRRNSYLLLERLPSCSLLPENSDSTYSDFKGLLFDTFHASYRMLAITSAAAATLNATSSSVDVLFRILFSRINLWIRCSVRSDLSSAPSEW